jgi:hypothetical protein
MRTRERYRMLHDAEQVIERSCGTYTYDVEVLCLACGHSEIWSKASGWPRRDRRNAQTAIVHHWATMHDTDA